MAHSIKKGSFIDDHLMRKVETQDGSEKKQVVKIRPRRSTIFPNFIGHTFVVYNGRGHVPAYVTGDMVSHKLGEFAPIRTFKGHTADDKKTSR